MSERRWALATFLVATVGFVVVAAWRIPWHPVPGGTPPPVPAGTVFTPAQIARANAYTDPARHLAWASLAVSLVVTLVLGFTPLGARLVGRLRGWWWVRVLLAVLLLAVIGRLVTLPFAIIGHHRSVEYGLSNEAWGPWAVDQVKGLVLSVVISGLLLLVLIGCARRWTRAWPAVAGVLLGGLVMLGSFVYPVLVEPAFNHFTPLPDGPLRTQILQVAAAEHVHLDDVLIADASRRTTTLNAYVSGYGSTRRVVLYDNVLRDLPRDQILAIVAHELGHARHDDVLTGSLLAAFGATLGIGLLALVLPLSAPTRSPARSDGRAAGPGPRGARHACCRARSTTGCRVSSRPGPTSTRCRRPATPTAFVAMQRQLALSALSDQPPAWSQFWFGSHPTTLERIAIAEQLGRRLGVPSAGAAQG